MGKPLESTYRIGGCRQCLCPILYRNDRESVVIVDAESKPVPGTGCYRKWKKYDFDYVSPRLGTADLILIAVQGNQLEDPLNPSGLRVRIPS